MTTIKGGIRFEKGKIPQQVLDSGIKLPFEAVGWESEKMAYLVPEGKDLKEKVVLPEGLETTVVSKYLYTDDFLAALKLKELQKLAKKNKITGKTKKVLIDKLKKIEVR